MTTKPTAMELHIYSPEQVLAAAAIGPASGIALPTCLLITRWLVDALKRDHAKQALCMTCEATFGRHTHDWSVVVITPMAEDGTAIVSGLCPTCTKPPDLLTRVFGSVRRIIPDAQIIQEGHA
jgi:hypothetical protein